MALTNLLGVVAAPIVLQLDGADRLLAPRFKAASLLRTRVNASNHLTHLSEWIESARPDLVIGCGRVAAAVLRAIKHSKIECQTVQILAPDCSLRHFDWVICPEHDRLDGPNVLTSLGSIHTIESQLTPSCNQANALLLLLGQPNKNAAWTQNQLRALLVDLCKWPGQIYISTSRRSGFDIAALIAASPLSEHSSVEVFQSGSAAPNPYLRWLLSARTIVVTPDSVNMVSEAMATRAQVIVPWQSSARGKIARFLQANGVRLQHFDPRSLSHERTQAEPRADCEALGQTLKRNLGLG